MTQNSECFQILKNFGEYLDLPVSGANLAQAIWLSGMIPPPALCSGLGKCGECRVRFLHNPPAYSDQEMHLLGQTAIHAGWRLACRHKALPGMQIALPERESEKVTRWTEKSQTLQSSSLQIAVDIGTTTLQWQILDVAAESILGTGCCLNPQMGAGSDVISRLAFASKPGGRTRLRNLVLQTLQKIVQDAKQKAAIAKLCIAGNTAMTAILLDLDIACLAHAPYSLPLAGGAEYNLPNLPPVWIPPQPAPFIGGDLAAGMAYMLYCQKPNYPFLLADLGTNGEFVLASDPETALLASVPLGPALEGIGLTLGGIALPGTTDRFTLEPQGIVPHYSAGKPGKKKICGTGYLSLISCMLQSGLLDAFGCLSRANPLAWRLSRQIVDTENGWQLNLPDDLFLQAGDVEEILKVRAAFSLALSSLLAEAHLCTHDLASVQLAGALGRHADTAILENLGFLPSGMGKRTHAAGNTSLAGAAFLLQHPEKREALAAWSKHCRVLNLVDRPDFTQAYMQQMHF